MISTDDQEWHQLPDRFLISSLFSRGELFAVNINVGPRGPPPPPLGSRDSRSNPSVPLLERPGVRTHGAFVCEKPHRGCSEYHITPVPAVVSLTQVSPPPVGR